MINTSFSALIELLLAKLNNYFWPIGQFFQVAIHFHLSHLQPKMINTSFSALIELLLAKLNNYFYVYIYTNTFFWLFKLTLNIGDTAPLKDSYFLFYKKPALRLILLSNNRSHIIPCFISSNIFLSICSILKRFLL